MRRGCRWGLTAVIRALRARPWPRLRGAIARDLGMAGAAREAADPFVYPRIRALGGSHRCRCCQLAGLPGALGDNRPRRAPGRQRDGQCQAWSARAGCRDHVNGLGATTASASIPASRAGTRAAWLRRLDLAPPGLGAGDGILMPGLKWPRRAGCAREPGGAARRQEGLVAATKAELFERIRRDSWREGCRSGR
jgi:hypothetical protein